jgi:hypothetical protein
MNRRMVVLALTCIALTPHADSQFIQQGGKLIASDPSSSDPSLGWSAAISADGNTAIAGGIFDGHTLGAAWVFTRTSGVWSQQGSKLYGTNADMVAYQGYSVALSADGNTAVVGADDDNNEMGAIWVFTRSGGNWTQQGNKLVGSNGVEIVYQGSSASISADGNTVIEGGPNDSVGIGASWVFVRSAGVWSQQGSKLVSTDQVGQGNQGHAVSISGDGNTALVGGPFDDSDKGAAWIYVRNGGVWTQLGSKLVGTGAAGAATQGVSAAISGDGKTAIIGGRNDNGGAGAAWVFVWNGSSWVQQGPKLVGTGAVGPAGQGSSVSISSTGNTALVAGWGDNGGVGAVWVYIRVNGVWSQFGSKLVGTGAADTSRQGKSVALSSDGNTFILGGSSDSSGTGAVWFFRNTAGAGVEPEPSLPSTFGLDQNYPDPFNPSTTITYRLPESAHVLLKVYNLLGQEVETLVNAVQSPGLKSVAWNGGHAASGVYFYRIVAGYGSGSFMQSRKMLFTK